MLAPSLFCVWLPKEILGLASVAAGRNLFPVQNERKNPPFKHFSSLCRKTSFSLSLSYFIFRVGHGKKFFFPLLLLLPQPSFFGAFLLVYYMATYYSLSLYDCYAMRCRYLRTIMFWFLPLVHPTTSNYLTTKQTLGTFKARKQVSCCCCCMPTRTNKPSYV